MNVQDGTYELYHPFELNLYIDTIMKPVLMYGGTRKIIFSCFHPDICTMQVFCYHWSFIFFCTQKIIIISHFIDPLQVALEAEQIPSHVFDTGDNKEIRRLPRSSHSQHSDGRPFCPLYRHSCMNSSSIFITHELESMDYPPIFLLCVSHTGFVCAFRGHPSRSDPSGSCAKPRTDSFLLG